MSVCGIVLRPKQAKHGDNSNHAYYIALTAIAQD